MLNLKVQGIHCASCVGAIKQALMRIAPEALVKVDINKGEVLLDGITNRDQAITAIEDAGYDVIGDVARE